LKSKSENPIGLTDRQKLALKSRQGILEEKAEKLRERIAENRATLTTKSEARVLKDSIPTAPGDKPKDKIEIWTADDERELMEIEQQLANIK
jgi:hypothetical protein